jgi:hypothetical protein
MTTTVTDDTHSLTEDHAPAAPEQEQAEKWASAYADRINDSLQARLSLLSQSRGGANGSHSANGAAEPHIGDVQVGQYVSFDVAATSPIQITGLPPYQPGKVIAAGEKAYLVAIGFVNPVPSIPQGFAVPPTVQLGGRRWRMTLDLANITDGTRQTLVRTGTFGPVADVLTVRVFELPTPDPGADAAVYEANVTFDIVDKAQPYAAFATTFLDVDSDPGFLFVPPQPPGWRHDLPNRYMVYDK